MRNCLLDACPSHLPLLAVLCSLVAFFAPAGSAHAESAIDDLELSGVYFIRLETPGDVKTIKTNLTR